MLERAVAFAQKFIAPESGAWLGYLHRDTTVSMNIIGGAYKGFFHVPRALMFCVDACDRILAAQKSQQ
jgi:N-acylglucosamine 2-epimerase